MIPTTSNVSQPRKFGFGCALDSHLFRLATGFGQRVTIETAPSEAPRVDTASSPDEIVDESGRVFARSQFDGGEGLFRAHQDGASPDRFWASKGVSVAPAGSGEFPEVRLANDTSRVFATAETGLRAATDGSSVWVCDGTTLRRTDDPTVDTPTFSADDPHDEDEPTDVLDVAVLGDEVFAALGANGIHKKDSGGWGHYSDLEATRIWAVQGRIVAAKDESLYEVVSSGAAPSATTTLPPGHRWTGLADAGSAVLVSADDGYVYAFTDDEGTLALAGQTLFENDTPSAVGSTQGVVAVGTSEGRLWVGQLADSFTLAGLRLVREWDDACPCRIVGGRTSLYTAVKDGVSESAVWRYELSTGGISHYLTLGAAGLSPGIVSVDGRLLVTVDGSGVWRQETSYVDSGFLVGPLGDFFSASNKSWVSARLETGDIPSGGQVELFYTTDPEALADPDSSAWIRVISRAAGDNVTDRPLTNVVARSLAGMVRLTRGGDDTPSVRSFAFRAYASAGDGDVIVTLPVNISDRVERRGRHRSTVRGRGSATYSTLKQFEGRSALLTLYRPGEMVRGLVETVGVPVVALTSRGSPTTVAVVTFRGQRVTSVASTTGVGTFATGRMFAAPPKFGAKL